MAIILITHDMGVIAGRTDRVIVMYAGKIAEEAKTDELFHRMRHPYALALLQSIPKLEQDSTQKLYTIPGLPPDLSKEITNCRFSPRCPSATERCRIAGAHPCARQPRPQLRLLQSGRKRVRAADTRPLRSRARRCPGAC
jgi:oligopeptide/dipeptide ABC transporter ATP-binding protein